MTIAYSLDRNRELKQANDGFVAKLNFLGAAMGQPDLVDSAQIDHALIERYVAKGRMLRAVAVRDGFRQIATWIAQGIRLVAAKTSNWYRHRQDMKILFALDERMLKDIGLTTGDVQSLARGILSVDDINAQREKRVRRYSDSSNVCVFESRRSAKQLASSVPGSEYSFETDKAA